MGLLQRLGLLPDQLVEILLAGFQLGSSSSCSSWSLLLLNSSSRMRSNVSSRPIRSALVRSLRPLHAQLPCQLGRTLQLASGGGNDQIGGGEARSRSLAEQWTARHRRPGNRSGQARLCCRRSARSLRDGSGDVHAISAGAKRIAAILSPAEPSPSMTTMAALVSGDITWSMGSYGRSIRRTSGLAGVRRQANTEHGMGRTAYDVPRYCRK